jgi:hypothetical protein
MQQTETELKRAEAKAYESERNVAVQRLIVQRLAKHRLSTAMAKLERRQMEEALRIHREHLERLQNTRRAHTGCGAAAGLNPRQIQAQSTTRIFWQHEAP